MANNVYVVDQLATGIETITIDDDGTGLDWLVFEGVFAVPTDVRLGQTSVNGTSTSASGFYFAPLNNGHRLIINGLIENVRGSNGLDFIQGNELGNLLYGDATATSTGGGDTIDGFDGNDSIYGGAGNDSVGGGADQDQIFGNAGADTLSGGAGSDRIEGGAGADVLSGGGDYFDLVSYASSTAGVRVTLTFGAATTGRGGHAAGDLISGFSDVIGSGHDDVITDSVKTTMAFGYNDSQFFGEAGNDTLRLGGGADLGRGGTGDDQVWGEAGNDRLYGDAGVDVIRGGEGADSLFGGTGADRFVFAALADSTSLSIGRDQIRDFSRRQGDKIDLSPIDATPATAGNAAFTWRGGQGFSGTAGEVRWREFGDGALVLADTDGDRSADFALVVMNISTLRETDFLL